MLFSTIMARWIGINKWIGCHSQHCTTLLPFLLGVSWYNSVTSFHEENEMDGKCSLQSWHIKSVTIKPQYLVGLQPRLGTNILVCSIYLYYLSYYYRNFSISFSVIVGVQQSSYILSRLLMFKRSWDAFFWARNFIACIRIKNPIYKVYFHKQAFVKRCLHWKNPR